MRIKIMAADLVFFLIPVFCAGLILVVFLKFLIPQVATIVQNRQILAQKQAHLATLVRKAQELEVLDEASLKSQFDKAALVLPQEKEVVLVLANLKGVAGQNGLSLGKIELSPGRLATASPTRKGGTDFSSLAFKIHLDGTLSGLKTFLSEIQKTAPVLEIESLGLTHKGGAYSAELAMEFFWQPPLSALGKASDPLPELSPQEQETLASVSQYKAFPPVFFETPATASSQVRSSPFE